MIFLGDCQSDAGRGLKTRMHGMRIALRAKCPNGKRRRIRKCSFHRNLRQFFDDDLFCLNPHAIKSLEMRFRAICLESHIFTWPASSASIPRKALLVLYHGLKLRSAEPRYDEAGTVFRLLANRESKAEPVPAGHHSENCVTSSGMAVHTERDYARAKTCTAHSIPRRPAHPAGRKMARLNRN